MFEFNRILDIDLLEFDHYTIIVADAKKTSDFYINILGFTLLEKKQINTGTVEQGEVDMLNYILLLPGSHNKTCVVTQGLNDRTFFTKYLKKNGPGIHHVAYQVSNINRAFNILLESNISLVTKKVVRDPVSGLKQLFIDKQYTGHYIELIERTNESKNNEFTYNNMRALAKSMDGQL